MKRKHLVVLGAVAVVGTAAALIAFGLHRAREVRLRRECMSNVRQIVIACQIYSNCANDRFPPSLGELIGGYITDCKLFLCPAAGKAVEFKLSDIPGYEWNASTVWSERYTDYVYVPGLGGFAPPDAVVAFDREGNHDGGRWVGFVGGMVTWMKEPEFRAALAETEAWLKEHPRPAPPPRDDEP